MSSKLRKRKRYTHTDPDTWFCDRKSSTTVHQLSIYRAINQFKSKQLSERIESLGVHGWRLLIIPIAIYYLLGPFLSRYWCCCLLFVIFVKLQPRSSFICDDELMQLFSVAKKPATATFIAYSD